MLSEMKRTFCERTMRERGEQALAQFLADAETYFRGPVRETRRIVSPRGHVTVFLEGKRKGKAEKA